MKTTLLIMAAGIGSRFGTGIKQLEPVDDAGHIIMDYSIHDAIEASTGSNCLIPVPKRLPIPAAMISNVVFILSPFCVLSALCGYAFCNTYGAILTNSY